MLSQPCLVHHLLPYIFSTAFGPPFTTFPRTTPFVDLLQPGWYQTDLFNLVINQDSDRENTDEKVDEGGEKEMDLAVEGKDSSAAKVQIENRRTRRSKGKVAISTGNSDNEIPGT